VQKSKPGLLSLSWQPWVLLRLKLPPMFYTDVADGTYHSHPLIPTTTPLARQPTGLVTTDTVGLCVIGTQEAGVLHGMAILTTVG